MESATVFIKRLDTKDPGWKKNYRANGNAVEYTMEARRSVEKAERFYAGISSGRI